jgi:hypothetical protein
MERSLHTPNLSSFPPKQSDTIQYVIRPMSLTGLHGFSPFKNKYPYRIKRSLWRRYQDCGAGNALPSICSNAKRSEGGTG